MSANMCKLAWACACLQNPLVSIEHFNINPDASAYGCVYLKLRACPMLAVSLQTGTTPSIYKNLQAGSQSRYVVITCNVQTFSRFLQADASIRSDFSHWTAQDLSSEKLSSSSITETYTKHSDDTCMNFFLHSERVVKHFSNVLHITVTYLPTGNILNCVHALIPYLNNSISKRITQSASVVIVVVASHV